MKTEIRTFHSCDIDQISDLENQLFSDPWNKELLLQSCSLEYCWVLEEEENLIIGYLIGQLVLDEFSIYNIAVKEKYQSCGYGKKLLDFLIDFLKEKNCVRIFLEVRSQNSQALRLYSGYGFIPIHVRRNYYNNPQDDAIMMVLDMNKKDKNHEEV